MAVKPYYAAVPNAPPEWNADWALRMSSAVNLLISKANGTADLTLTANAASTVMVDPRLSAVTVLSFMPTTANAATAKQGIYVDTQKQGYATVHHANNAQTDKTFRVGMIG